MRKGVCVHVVMREINVQIHFKVVEGERVHERERERERDVQIHLRER